MNLRPPGPQPEGRGVGQLMEAVFAGVLVSECSWVFLNLFPELFPVRSAKLHQRRTTTPRQSYESRQQSDPPLADNLSK